MGKNLTHNRFICVLTATMPDCKRCGVERVGGDGIITYFSVWQHRKLYATFHS